jgi:hypothetical protein
MMKSRLVIAALAISTLAATPAFAQWQTQEPAVFAAQYPNGDHSAAFGAPRDAMAFVPSVAKTPRSMVMRATKGK